MDFFWTILRLKKHVQCVHKCAVAYEHADLDVAQDFECIERRSSKHAWQPPCQTVGAMPFWAAYSPEDVAPSSAVSNAENAESEEAATDEQWLQHLLQDQAQADDSGWLTKILCWAQVHGNSSDGVVGHGDSDKLDIANACISLASDSFGVQRLRVTSGRWKVMMFNKCGWLSKLWSFCGNPKY